MKKALFLAILIATTPGVAHTELPQYVMRDLGTFGFRSAVAYDVNSSGQVVGLVYLEDLTTHAFYYDGTFHDLGPGAAFAVNDTAVVAGRADPETGAQEPSMAWYWDGSDHYLGSGYATGINSEGAIVGQQTPDYRATRWTLEGSGTDLGTLGGNSSWAWAVNGQGQVVGASAIRIPSHPVVEHAFLWQDGAMNDLGTLPNGSQSAAYAINDAGVVVGSATGPLDPVTETRTRYAVMWDADGDIQKLWAGGATGINDMGWVIGRQGLSSPVIWADDQLRILPLGGFLEGSALGISASVVVAGFAGSHAVLWEPVPEPDSFVALAAEIGWFTMCISRRNRRNPSQARAKEKRIGFEVPTDPEGTACHALTAPGVKLSG